MKYLILALALVAGSAFARDVYVQPHYNSNGAFVPGHYRTVPDANPYNNYSTQGNTNPYTGQAGNVNPHTAPQPSYRPPVQSPPSNRGNSGYRQNGF